MNTLDAVDLLIAEDDLGHAKLIQRNLKRSGISNQFRHFTNGQQLLDELEERCRGGLAPTLVLLDLNMPELDGFSTLQKIRANPELRELPVIILTTTSEPVEIERCYDLGCNAFVTKPVDYAEFCDAIEKLGRFLTILEYPNGAYVSSVRTDGSS